MQERSFVLSFVVICLFCLGCSSDSGNFTDTSKTKGEFIYRQQDENVINMEPLASIKKELYPWEDTRAAQAKITKEYFRCKGSVLNPVKMIQKEKEVLRFYDCGGSQKHSLPLRDEKEFVYPILIDLLNHLQENTGRKVVITCAHCCPDHNAYLDPSPANQVSKHLIGAEVDFYVQGMESQPEKIVNLLISYYQVKEKYIGKKDFIEFKRYEKNDIQLKTMPWFNKEVFIKLYQKSEGRDFDNRHPYPYLSIQVRYDFDLNEKVVYSWDKAFKNFLRY